MAKDDLPDLTPIFEDGRQIDEAVRDAHQKVIQHHRRTGNPLVVWKDGAIKEISAFDGAEDPGSSDEEAA